MKSLKDMLKDIPVLGPAATRLYWGLAERGRKREPFPGSAEYWEKRYAAGGNSGAGSYAHLAQFKADVLNRFVADHGVRTVIELGCGDGNQLGLARYPDYTGYDVSSSAIQRCRELFKADPHKSFRLMDEYQDEQADLSMSLDVIYHLVEDTVFEGYMRTLFAASRRYVVIYASDTDENKGYAGTHVRHRKFSTWVSQHAPGWRLIEHVPNRHPYQGDYQTGSFADFYFYEKS